MYVEFYIIFMFVLLWTDVTPLRVAMCGDGPTTRIQNRLPIEDKISIESPP